jgi:replicative DNA helicase Mcm
MAEKRENEERIAEAKGFFDTYKKEIGQSIREDKRVIQVDFNDLSSFSHLLAEEVLNSPEEILQILETALDDLGLIKNARVRFLNIPETQQSKIGHIRAKHLNKFIAIEGIVRQASDVRPQVVNAKFECPTCGTIISVLQIEKKFREPSRCSCGRKGQFRLISKEMVDAQRIIIEESPESLMGGEQPRRLQVFLQEDHVEPRMEEKTTPGSRVRVIGILKEVPVPLQTGSISTRFDLAIEANNLIPLEETYEEVKISDEDERQIQELAADAKIFDKMAASIAPSIWGYDEIKKALVLQMFSGVRKVAADRTVKRGDIHILLMGDPGVAKSVTLKFIADMAPKGRYIVGKAASGAGITATVVKDEYLKGWALEAGAMVLANKGIVCIDEIEKMDPNDRSAMHEAMEQQTVTISKANVQACYSEDTEVLTEDGWKKYNEVENLKIAQYNPENNVIKFLKHKGLFVYDYNKKMYHFKNKRNDILVTPNHKMLFREPRQKKFIAMPAEEISYNRMEFINSGSYDNQDAEYFILPAIKHKQKRIHEKYVHQHKEKNIPLDLWLEFIGYYVSEGGKETLPTISITQKLGKNAEKIETCLKKLSEYVGFTLTKIPYKNYLKFKITSTQLSDYLIKNCGERVENKKIPLKISEISKRQLTILFNALMLGDGSKDGKNFGSVSEQLINEMQMIGLLLGKSTSQHISYKAKSRGNRQEFYRLVFSDRITPQIKKSSIKKIDYKGKVWCFSTETGFFITRRKGKIAIQGNTLQAQTSVLAAGNPKLGRFEPFQTIAQQIDLPPSLINRFDVIFVLRDIPDKFKDESIASHVLALYQKNDRINPVERDIFRKYVAYAKQKIHPILSDEAVKEIREFYVKMRNAPVTADTTGNRAIPISARQLEALVRLSEAHAKMRLSKRVTKDDAKIAIDIIKYYMMQVGYDSETKSFDIDRIAIGVSSSQRSKVILLRETISKLEERLGKFIPHEELEKELEGKLSKDEIEDAIQKLIASGDVFIPRKGFVQRI